MSQPTGVQTRPLSADDPSVAAMALAAGAHGVYVRNAQAAGEGEGFVLRHEGVDRGLGWFGPRGNLVLIGAEPLGEAVVAGMLQATLAQRQPWRIAMGPAAVVNALRERTVAKVLLLRDQIYYAGSASTAAAELVRADVRSAERADRDRLGQATLQLNASDLKIDPARVDRRWLRDSIDQRLADGSTFVVGPLGSPWCKLDHGSDGPGGLVIEGVFTFPEHRGGGLAAALVATSLRRAPGAVCLHVGMHNAPARRAYERAGMSVVARCRLLLLG